jgi:hypothetical protein
VAHAWAYGWQVFIGVVLASLGAAQWLDAPVLVTALVLGVTATHGTRMLSIERKTVRTPAPPIAHRGVPWPDTAPLVPFLSAGLFVYAAAALPWSEWAALINTGKPGELVVIATLALLIVAARVAAKFVGVSLAAPWAKTRRSQAFGLALALQPTGVTGLALLMQVQLAYAPLQTQAQQAAWLALAIFDLVSPVILMLVLSYSGESIIASRRYLSPVSSESQQNPMTHAAH